MKTALHSIARSALKMRAGCVVVMEDYTKWREQHMYIGESVHETAARAKAAAARLDASMAMA